MKIKLLTTERKLSKSLLNQMRQPNIVQMKEGKVLGYVVNPKKDYYKGIIIQHDEDYFMVADGFRKGMREVTRKTGKWTTFKSFETFEMCDEWWEAYTQVQKKATRQIYI